VQEGTRFSLERAGELYRKRYWRPEVFGVVERLAAFVEGRGHELTQVALSWVLAQPGITSAILGASRPEQLRDSLQAIDLQLDDEELQACDDVWYSLPRERDPSVAQR
jgi:aryl-alcohol dehydrogenase-like predicted oxidoreductase